MPGGYDAFPPNGFDRADGEDIRPGTPTPDSAILRSPDYFDLGFLEEMPDSPEIERGEQATIRHRFAVDWESGRLIILAIGRGAIFTDSYGLVYRVLTSQLQHDKPDKAILTITSESLSFDTPPDDYDVEDIEINPEIEKHPSFVVLSGDGITNNPYNLDIHGNVVNAGQFTGPQIIEICKQAAAASSIGANNDIFSRISTTTVAASWPYFDNNGNQIYTFTAAQIIAIANQLYMRYLKGETTFYLAGWKVTWVQYFYLPQLLDGGGYLQDPVLQGGVPAYFWSDDQTPTGQNTLLAKAIVTNPLIYLGGISWLRTADRSSYSRTWFRLVRTWIGAPLGHWDRAVYPTYN